MLGDVSEEDVDGGGVIRLIIRVAIRIEPWQSRGGGRKGRDCGANTHGPRNTRIFQTSHNPSTLRRKNSTATFLPFDVNERSVGRKKRKLKAVPILWLVSITPPLVSWIAGRGGCSKYSVLNVLGEGD